MNDILERMARAAFDAWPVQKPDSLDHYTWDEYEKRWPTWKECQLQQARASIAAMREPTEAMQQAADECADWGPVGHSDHENGAATPAKCWRAMIDAVLGN